MLCPVCKTKLTCTGQAKLETLDEHIFCETPSLKDKFECLNANCSTYNHVYWNKMGEYYNSDNDYKKEFGFIGGNSAPLGTFQRQLNVEIEKKDENYTLFETKKWRFRIVFKYKADRNGKVLKRWRKLEIWKRKCGEELWTLHIPGIKMLIYKIGEINRLFRNFNASHHPGTREKLILAGVSEKGEEWWRRLGAKYARWRIVFGMRQVLSERVCKQCKHCKDTYDSGRFWSVNCNVSSVFQPTQYDCHVMPHDCPFRLEHLMDLQDVKTVKA